MTTRVFQACQRCQRRKLKCNGEPQCSSCLTASQTCIYGSANRKRGLVEGYVRGLERLLGFAIRRDSSLTSDMRKLLSLQEPDPGEETSLSQETMLESWKKSTIAKEVDVLLPALEKGEARHWQSLFAAGTDPEVPSHEPLSARGSKLNPVQSNQLDTPLALDVQELDFLHSSSTDPHATLRDTESNKDATESSHWTEELESTPSTRNRTPFPRLLPGNAKHMIDEFLAYTNCWFPVLEPHELLRTFHQSRVSGDFDRRGRKSPRGQLAALWAVFAFESCKGGRRSGLPETGALHQHPVYNTARGLIPEEDHEHDLGHVQALLIMAMINLGFGHWKASWLLAGHALRLLQYYHIGQNLKSPNTFESSKGHHTRKPHILLGCFVLERLLAMRFGQILPTLSPFRPPPLPEDGLEEWETPRFPNLPPNSQYKPDIDIPAKILSTFNVLVLKIDRLGDLLSNLDREIDSDVYSPEHGELLKITQTVTAESYQNYIRSYYPQSLVRYLTDLCTLLVLGGRRRKAMQTHWENALEHDILTLDLITTLSSSLWQFTRIHGASRIPVILVAALHRIIEDIICLVKIPQFWDKAAAASTLQPLDQLLQQFGIHWPAFNSLHEILLSAVYLRSQPERPLRGDANLSSNTCSDLANTLNYTRSLSWSCLPPFAGSESICHTSASTMLDRSSGSGFQNFDLDVPGPKSIDPNILGDSHLAQDSGVLVDGVDDMYIQLAEADIMEWSGNWQQDGLRELGFDNNAFEQLYSKGQ
ncbi:uncharacterized protein Z518_05726 [Rhinocladiella mackenziei CBS 650.93]|uniref:Rhinocladiella mackenziei CBS 650.93 unplaced genomic scaffold supercont1.4, whole genome shotgun sequence n=1 Tax=Rhinocladiella mackenziei CBS 650.93 TaxID=1442369 RepID=A0A0D2J6Z9_9EURO|nr:uncharacterized protein Z518_05726 [Rhinocladiella mackenziei CBS 650.93]KIX04855.1 hypothetical protein Z518_05726 [Rhinocladiella mackenziei CBS 650.93]